MGKDLQYFNAMAEQVADMVLEKLEFRLKTLLTGHTADFKCQLDESIRIMDDLMQTSADIVTSSGELRRKLRSRVPAPTLLPSKNRSKAVMVG